MAFLSINPMHPGHTLVVPRAEVDHWIDLDPELPRTCSGWRRPSARRRTAALDARRIGVMIVGDEVPHVHIHVVPFDAARRAVVRQGRPQPAGGVARGSGREDPGRVA